jgi:hypothetical protein
MALSLEAFEQMTAESPPTERTPPRVFAPEVPTLAITDELKLNNNAAGFSLAPPAIGTRQRSAGFADGLHSQNFASGHVKFDNI